MIGVNVDITDAREAERVLRESAQQLRIALRAGRMGIWRANLETGKQAWDAREYELFGVDPSTPVSREVFLSRVHPADVHKVDAAEHSPLTEEQVLDTSFRIVLPDGSIRWLAGHSVAGPDILGGVERIGVNFDITEQKETEQRLLLLVDELNHRVKNTLAIVQSLAYQTFKGTSAEDARRAFEGRLITLANSHSYLTNSDWDGVVLDALLKQAFSSQGVGEHRFSLSGPRAQLKTKSAFALALAFHELCTNAIKHGALANDNGRIDVAWRSGESLNIEWKESGGPPVSPPTRRGFGSKLIEQSLAKDLRGRVATNFEPEGMQCLIEIPRSTSLQ
jgi:two-component sensor histidine kinase